MNEAKTGYPSKDKPWLKYYSEETINSQIPDVGIYEFLEERNKRNLSQVAINYLGNKVTYKMFFENIEKITKSFFSLGIHEEPMVMFFALNIPECIYAIYALNRLGVVIDLEYLTLKEEAVIESVKNMKVNTIITVDMFLPIIEKAVEKEESIKRVIVIETSTSLPLVKKTLMRLKNRRTRLRDSRFIRYVELLKFPDTDIKYPVINGDMEAVIVRTGGTTGKPKGVVLTNRNLNAIAIQYINHEPLDLRRGERMLNIAPPFYAFGISLAIHAPLAIGLCICLSPSPNPGESGKLFYKYKPHHFLGGPAHINSIIDYIDSKRIELSFLRTLACGGESMSLTDERNTIDFFHKHGAKVALATGYGMSEFCGTTTTNPNPPYYKEGSVGFPFPFTNVKIIDPENKSELKYNEIGELCMSSPSLMKGYYEDIAEEQNLIITDENNMRWLRTGDLGYMDSEGFIFLKGRIKRIYMSKGEDGCVYKLFPDYIENVLQEIPEVMNCAVIAKTEDSLHYKPIALIVLREKIIGEIKENIENYCRKHLADYMIPDELLFVDDIPVTQEGKKDYKTLEEMADNMIIRMRSKNGI